NPNDSTHRATDDYYSFVGHAGDIMNVQAMSSALTRDTKAFDTVLSLYDSAGKLLATSDDEFETHDSWIVDYHVQSDGVYYVQVDSFTPDGIVDFNTGNYELFLYTFSPPDPGHNTRGGHLLVARAAKHTA